jgi:hypothetical protein
MNRTRDLSQFEKDQRTFNIMFRVAFTIIAIGWIAMIALTGVCVTVEV